MIRSIRIFFALLVMWVAALTLQGQSSSNLSIAISTIEQARGLARYPDSSLAVLQGLDAQSLDDSLKVEYHKTKGMAFFYKGILDSSIAAYSTAMALVDTSRCTDQSAVVTNGLAVVLHAAGLKGEAINYYSKALGCAEFRGDDPLKLKIYNNLSILNRELGRYQWAQRYLDKAFELTDPGNTAAWASLYNSRGQNFLLVQKYDSAQVNFLRSDEFRHEEDLKGKAIGLNNLGYVASLQGDMTLAMDYYQRAAKIREKIGDRFGSASIFINMANIAIEEDNLTRAKDLIRNAELLNDQVHSPEVASRILASRSAMAEKEGNAALALHLMREFKKMDDSLRTDEVMREAANAQYTVALVEAQNRVKRIQKEEEAQAAAIERQRLISMSLAVAIAVFIGLLSLLLYQLKQLSDLRKALTQQRDEAESKAQVRRETLNAVVHELRTPMRAIISLAELIQVEKDPQELLDMTKLLKNSSERLLGINNNILTFSRIEEGSAEPVLQKNNLSKLVEGLCKELAPQAATKGIEFRVQIEPGILAVLDHSMMEIVLMNLIGNALKYTRSGSVTVTVNEADAKAVVEVRDTGPGIPEADQERIFEAFFQSKVTLAAGTDGSGLGLSICKHYVEQMNGELELSSVEGEGSTFSVVLPQD